MNTNNDKNTNVRTNATAETLCKLGLDVHAASIMVARQVEGLHPQPPQRFKVAAFVTWVQEQVAKGFRVVSCYEAGPTGYWLHRKLEAVGATNYVVCPSRLDSRGKGVNTDKTDALELLVRLDRYVAGNRKAFSLVQVPGVEQERKRLVTRQRQQLRDKRLSFAAQGRMLMLSQGYRQSNSWWKKSSWEPLQQSLPEWLVQRLVIFVRLIEALNEEISVLERAIQEQAPKSLP